MKIHHIGYLVKNIEKSAAAFEAAGFERVLYSNGEFIFDDNTRQCDISFMRICGNISGGSCIELVAPQSPDCPIYGLMKQYKNSPYHICFESENLDDDVARLKQSGWSVFLPSAPAPAIDGRNVVFLIHRSAGIIEIVDSQMSGKN